MEDAKGHLFSRNCWGSSRSTRTFRLRVIGCIAACAIGNGDRSAIHEELLLTIEPCPREYDVAIREVRRNREKEGLIQVAFTTVSTRAVTFVTRDDAKCCAVVDREANLTGAAPVITAVRFCLCIQPRE
jgi:hypothetical protein